MSLSIIILVKNLEQIGDSLISLRGTLRQFKYEICLVYDLADERTIKELHTYADLSLIKSNHPGHPGSAIYQGMMMANYKKLVVTMGDGCDNWNDIPEMANLLDHFCVVSTNRFGSREDYSSGNQYKGWVTRLGAQIFKLAWGWKFNDPTNNFKAYRKEILNLICPLNSLGFSIGLEILLKCFVSNLPMTEIHTKWRDDSPSYLWVKRISSYIPFLLKPKGYSKF